MDGVETPLGSLLLLAHAVSPFAALALLAVIFILYHPFRREAYGRPAVTLLGEVVRSYSEKIIADWFSRNGIRYVYEYPAFDWKGSVISKPDFYLPDYGVYVEYWGLRGTGKEYDKTMKWKAAQYQMNGVRVVSLYLGELANLDGALGSRLGRATRSIQPPMRGAL